MGVRETTKNAKIAKVRLGDILTDTITGEWGSDATPGTGVLVLRTTNFTCTGEVDYGNVVSRDIPVNKVEKKRLLPGDLIVEKSGGTKDHPVGRVVYFDRKDATYLCNNFTQAIRPNTSFVFPRYLLHVLLTKYSNGSTESMYNKTTGIQNLKMSLYLDQQIPLPALPEQKRIAEELDRICELKTNAEERLALMDELVKSRFVEMFGDPVANPLGWKVRKISEFAEVKIGPFGSVLHKEDYVSGGHPLVNPSHMKDGQICVDDDLTLADEKYNELEVYHLRVGDVVVARRGEIGRCALVESDGLFCGTGSMFVRVKGDCRPDYLQRVISFPTYTAKLEFGAVGVTMKNINAGMIEDSLVPLPPMTLQDSFAAFVAEVDKSKLVLRETVAQMETLYKATLQEYFG